MQRRSRQSKNLLRALLEKTIFSSHPDSGRGRTESNRGHLLLEALEKRQLMAGDMELFCTDGPSGSEIATDGQEIGQGGTNSGGPGLQLEGEGEGEAAPDLVQFARDLAAAGVIFYGASFCPACTQQRDLFGDGRDDLPFVEVTNPDRSFNAIAQTENITQVPTWDFPDGTRLVGVQSLETISQASGVAIPISDTPGFASVGDLTVRIGSPLHVPIDAYDPGEGAVVTSVSVGDPSLLEATVLTGNRSLRLDLEGYGDLVFELFDGRAPRAAGRVADLANQGFYDGIIFHRVVNGFVIQAGDPTGTGTSGSSLGPFDDEFNPDLQHNTEGVLSFAKTTDDTNNSQFFITETATRNLDFNHSVFGQLVEGFDVREAISETQVNNLQQRRPVNNITIASGSTFTDNENSVVFLRALGNQTGSTTVTFTVTDVDGNTFSETVNVNIEQDDENSQPFLNEIVDPAPSPINTPATLQLSSIDIEGDAVTYFASSLSSNATVDVNAATGLVTVTPASGFTGQVNVNVGVRPGPGVFGNSSLDSDNQLVTFNFEGESVTTPTAIDLQTGSDTGSSNIDNVTNAGSLSFLVSGVADGQTVELINTGTNEVFGQQVASESTVVITIDNIAAAGDGTYVLAARTRIGNDVSELSPTVEVIYDTVPPASVVASAVTTGNVGRPYITDLISDEEGNGLVYALVSGPSGATIDAATGVINWTPTESQIGTQSFAIELTDLAGNTLSESFDVTIADNPVVEIALGVTDLQGNTIDSVGIGQEFLLTFSGVDIRLFNQPGVFAAYADILFDNTRIRPVAVDPIEFESLFSGVRTGVVGANQIDELGAFAGVTAPTNQRESLIATVRFEAIEAGTTIIRSEPADASNSDTLLFGDDNVIPPESIAYGTVQLTIGQNFTLTPDAFSVAEDSGTTALDVLANDTIDAGDGQLSVVSVTQPTTGGTVSLSGGTVSFTPAANFNGQAVFTYRVSDSNSAQGDASVTVTVTPTNDPPTGVEDTLTIVQDSGQNTLDVLANDSIAPDTGETLTITNVSASSQGAIVSVSANGQAVLYTPASGFTGTDSLTYTLSDGTLTSTVTLNVEVVTSNNPPTAVADSFSLSEDAGEAAYNVLANDVPDSDNEAFTLVDVGTPSNGGSARISPDGTQFFYTPAANFNGVETVTYTIRDSGGGTDVGTVTLSVAAVNDPPPGGNLVVNSVRGASEIQVFEIDNAANPDAGETLSLSTFDSSTSQGGTVRVDTASGTLFYTPPSDTFSGTDTFNYTVADSTGLTTSGVITIEVADFSTRSVTYQAASGTTLSALGGIRLAGTNAIGEDVNMEPVVVEGNLVFGDLLPGEYRIEVPANPFLQNGDEAQSIVVSSAPEDGDTTIQSTLGTLLPQFISIRDFLRSTPRQNLLVAVAPGQDHLALNVSNSVDTINNPAVALDDSGATLTVRGTTTDTTSQSESPVEATFLTTNDDRVQVRGEVNGLRLYRISVEQGAVTFASASTQTASASAPVANTVPGLASASSAASTQTDTPPSLQAGSSIPLTSLASAEGEAVLPQAEAVAAQSVTRTDVFVPPLAPATIQAGSSSSMLADFGGSQVDSVDAAMEQVAESLELRSAAGEGLAELALLDQQSVDVALRGGE